MASKPKRPCSKIPTPKEQEKFSAAHQNVLLERMEKQFSVFGEGLVLLTEKVDGLKSDVDGLKSEVGGLKSEMGEVKDRLGRVEERLGRIEEIVEKVLARFKSLETRVGGLESKREAFSLAASLPKDFEERFRFLEQRVASLESHVA